MEQLIRPLVFVCHNREDKPSAERIATAVIAADHEAFFDKWDIKPGDSLIEKISTGIGKGGEKERGEGEEGGGRERGGGEEEGGEGEKGGGRGEGEGKREGRGGERGEKGKGRIFLPVGLAF